MKNVDLAIAALAQLAHRRTLRGESQDRIAPLAARIFHLCRQRRAIEDGRVDLRKAREA
jgi:hypothetical protein